MQNRETRELEFKTPVVDRTFYVLSILSSALLVLNLVFDLSQLHLRDSHGYLIVIHDIVLVVLSVSTAVVIRKYPRNRSLQILFGVWPLLAVHSYIYILSNYVYSVHIWYLPVSVGLFALAAGPKLAKLAWVLMAIIMIVGFTFQAAPFLVEPSFGTAGLVFEASLSSGLACLLALLFQRNESEAVSIQQQEIERLKSAELGALELQRRQRASALRKTIFSDMQRISQSALDSLNKPENMQHTADLIQLLIAEMQAVDAITYAHQPYRVASHGIEELKNRVQERFDEKNLPPDRQWPILLFDPAKQQIPSENILAEGYVEDVVFEAAKLIGTLESGQGGQPFLTLCLKNQMEGTELKKTLTVNAQISRTPSYAELRVLDVLLQTFFGTYFHQNGMLTLEVPLQAVNSRFFCGGPES